MTGSDEQIKDTVQSRLLRDVQLDASNIGVDVVDGVATLTGTVPAYSGKAVAGDVALSTLGVREVINNLKVFFLADRLVPSDDELQQKVTTVLNWTSSVQPARIEVSAAEGTVTLKGQVRHFWHRQKVDEIVFGLSGVRDVRNELAVVPNKSVTDDLIAEDIVEEFENSPFLDPARVRIKVVSGVVTLTGDVDFFAFRREAERVASHTRGVREIKNLIRVELNLSRRAPEVGQ